jgi:hypothetical protein
VLRGRAFLLLLLLCCVPSFGSAQDVSSLPDVPLSLAGCPAEWSTRLRDLLRLELDALSRERAESIHSAVASIEIQCDGDHVIATAGLVSGRRSAVRVDQNRVEPETRPRAVALSTAELVDALLQARQAPPKPNAPPPEPASKSQSPTAPAPSLLAGVSARRVGRPGAWLPGIHLGGELPASRAVALALDLRLASGRSGAEPVSVDIRLGSLGAHLLIGSHAAPFRWGVGPGARVGWASLEGHPEADTNLQRLSGLWAGPGLLARFSHELRPRSLLLAASLDGGLITLPVKGLIDGQERVFAVDGAWLGVTVGIGLSL